MNEDRVTGGQGFGRHSHRDVEIISYVVSGILEHQDCMGHRALMTPGDVQRISAGTGIQHSEYNGSPVEPVHFLQIWIMPDQQGVKPEYAQKSFGAIKPGALNLVASKSGRDGSLPIHQDANVYVAKLSAAGQLQHGFETGRSGWLQLIEGALSLNGTELRAGDGAAISGEERLSLTAAQDSTFCFLM